VRGVPTKMFFIFLLLASNVFSQEDINILQQNAIKRGLGLFHQDDDFKILGSIEINGENTVLANNVHIGGQAKKATWRLLLFSDDGTLLGIYTGIVFNPIEIKIEGKKIIFPLNPETGNVIDFSEGIPDEIWIDGYKILFLRILKH
jgi:hypothetical protein